MPASPGKYKRFSGPASTSTVSAQPAQPAGQTSPGKWVYIPSKNKSPKTSPVSGHTHSPPVRDRYQVQVTAPTCLSPQRPGESLEMVKLREELRAVNMSIAAKDRQVMLMERKCADLPRTIRLQFETDLDRLNTLEQRHEDELKVANDEISVLRKELALAQEEIEKLKRHSGGKGGFEVEMEAPSVGFEIEIDVGGKGGFGIEIEAPSVEIEMPTVEVEIEMPSVEVEVEAPTMSVEVDIDVNVEQKSPAQIAPDLKDAFDMVDEDGAGLAPRLDLRKKVDEFVPQCAEVQKLSDTIRALDAMIVEKEEFEEFVDQWVSECPPS